MTNWTPARSVLLSQLLDNVVGTEEMVRIRQDYFKIWDCIRSTTRIKSYLTGSKAEGLDLPGSDFDIMFDINNTENVMIIQSMRDAYTTMNTDVFLLTNENVPPCFALLKSVNHIQSPILFYSCQPFYNAMYLSSSRFVHIMEYVAFGDATTARQGPSIEIRLPYMHTSQSGIDNVFSIHCPFWPDPASEWKSRHRRFGWPCQSDIKSIEEFGFHLVPVGHPHSDMNMMEWRISFSVAERTLVWSFNHVQMQCYAILKLILKEIINPRCHLHNRVLCSYFIKTFLFWKYEETNLSFWCQENFRDCIILILSGFRDIIMHGSLKHYFITKFNLFSVKLTAEARIEILRILNTIIKNDVALLQECNTLKPVWNQFVHTDCVVSESVQRRNESFLKTDEYLMNRIDALQDTIMEIGRTYLISVINDVSGCFQNVSTTCLIPYAVQIALLRLCKEVVSNYSMNRGNKVMYRSCQYFKSNTGKIDISTFQLWYAMLLTTRGDYSSSLQLINNILSNIPLFALYSRPFYPHSVRNERTRLYVDTFSNGYNPVTERARRAWSFDLKIMPADMEMVPSAIQIELTHCDKYHGVILSPTICAYYLIFLNYYGLHQYDDTDRAIRQLIDKVKNRELCGILGHHSLNIVGHCFLLLGLYEQARYMFLMSYEYTTNIPGHHRHNSARYYLQCLPP